MTPDEQEALSRLYSDDIIRLLPLSSGAVAVFNNARELCGILPSADFTILEAWHTWNPPKKTPAVDLQELGLL